MHLVTAIRGESTDVKLLVKLLIIFIALRLRQGISLFSMYHFSEEKLERLFLVTSEYWTALTLFGYSLSPSEWSIGKVVAVHAKWMFEKYKVGLGINTMQGREAKHVHIAAYSRHSHVRNRWLMIFRHDYIRNIWLPLQEPSLFWCTIGQRKVLFLRVWMIVIFIASVGLLRVSQETSVFIAIIKLCWKLPGLLLVAK